jgi:hypothetical protein
MTHDRSWVWRTADGRGVTLQEMKLGHLVNVINWISDNPEDYPGFVLELMIAEADYRKTFLFAEGRAYPQLLGRRWKIIDPKTGEGKIVKPPADYIENVKDNTAYQSMSKRTQAKRRNELS